jgi:hypothetical protein
VKNLLSALKVFIKGSLFVPTLNTKSCIVKGSRGYLVDFARDNFVVYVCILSNSGTMSAISSVEYPSVDKRNILRFDTTEIAAALLHGSKLLASFPIFYEADNAITEFWHQLFDAVPHLKHCSILSCKPRDNEIIKKFLQAHTESEVCYFHVQQQVFIESVKQAKQEKQETLQEPMQNESMTK